MWPLGEGLIHTSVQAGGMTIDGCAPACPRRSTALPFWSTYEKPRPRRMRRIPAIGRDRRSAARPHARRAASRFDPRALWPMMWRLTFELRTSVVRSLGMPLHRGRADLRHHVQASSQPTISQTGRRRGRSSCPSARSHFTRSAPRSHDRTVAHLAGQFAPPPLGGARAQLVVACRR